MSEQTPAPRRLTFGVRHMLYAMVWFALLLVVLMKAGWLLVLLLVVTAVLFLLSWAVAVLAERGRLQRDTLVKVMAISQERGIPLSSGLLAYSDLCNGSVRSESVGLAYLLDTGMALPVALRSIPEMLPREATVLASVGWEVDQPAEGWREATHAIAARHAYDQAARPLLGYLMLYLIVMQVVIWGFTYTITPKFEMIYADFGVALPRFTQALTGWVRMIEPLIPVLILLEVGVLVCLMLKWAGVFRSGWTLVDRIQWRRDSGIVLQALALGIDAGRPAPATLQLLGRMHPRAWLRGKLNRASVSVEHGLPWVQSLIHEGLIRPADGPLLDAASRSGHLAWALRSLAESYERRQSYRATLFSQLVFPVIVLCLAAIVFTFAVGYFMPLAHLIQAMVP